MPVTVVNYYLVQPGVQYTGSNGSDIVTWYNTLGRGSASLSSEAGGTASIHIGFTEYTSDVVLQTGDWFVPEGDGRAVTNADFTTRYRTV